MRWLALLLLLLCGAAAAQEEGQPQVTVELEPAELVPGQYATLRVTVLVPTWMPSPVAFPSFEVPNLRVRLPERSTTPVSGSVGGETWSGVRRRYLVSPMVPGRFDIPAQPLTVTFARPGGAEPQRVTVQTPPLTLTGSLPEGAGGLDPFIAATALTLETGLSGPTQGLRPGDGVTLTVTASIAGASPIVLPPLLPQVNLPGIRSYPGQPQVTEAEARGVLSGTRVETVSLMAQGGGSGEVPGPRLDWFNLDTGRVETATAPGFTLSVEGPPLRAAPWPWQGLVAGAAGLALAALLAWRLRPRFARAHVARRAARLASKRHARAVLLRAIAARDLPATLRMIPDWAGRPPRTGPAQAARVAEAVRRLTAARYGGIPAEPGAADWRRLADCVAHAPPPAPRSGDSALGPLNPAGPPP
ncbi:BatD family protein [Oceanicella sp. SM1341]|uniref:BatD family protein n=1 Tax=Oceanicella sp. SM1341 TaxID=1548889 RepID=UPI000E4D4937|nr:BatD family protein [Oceanicella sp. SM1341]